MVATVAVAGLAFVSACSDDPLETIDGRAVKAASASAEVQINPAAGSKTVRPDQPITVSTSSGRLSDVTVTGPGGQQINGTVRSRGRVWTSEQPMKLATDYKVTASANGLDGQTVQKTSTFSTLEPRQIVDTDLAPMPGETVGIGMPVIVYFSDPVRNKAAVERRLQVSADTPFEGAWHWYTDEEVHFRPKEFWPTGTEVTVRAPLAGTKVAPGRWLNKNMKVSYDIGKAMISTVNTDTHMMTVTRNGKTLRRIPVTSGSPGYTTRSGTKVVMEKHPVKIMDSSTIGIGAGSSDYYRLTVRYALRVTWSGEFVHSAPWSVGSQGVENVSHGCVGMAPSNAIWFYNLSSRGDIIKVTNSGRHLEQGNGYTDWDIPFSKYAKGSALS